MTYCKEIKWDRIVICLSPNYPGKTIRRESSRSTLTGAVEDQPGAEVRHQQPSVMTTLAKAVASPTGTPSHRPEEGRSGDGSQGSLSRDRTSHLRPR